MKHHPAWLAAGLLVFVVLACNLGKLKNANTNSNSKANANTASGTETGAGAALKEIHMAKDDDGSPGEETDSFAPGDRTVHCVATLKEAKSGTKLKFSWWIVDADGTQNQKLKEIDYTTKALENVVNGHLTLPQNWPAGKYKVEVYVNGELDRTALYTVK
jgi:Large extracellular alpha-helical protein